MPLTGDFMLWVIFLFLFLLFAVLLASCSALFYCYSATKSIEEASRAQNNKVIYFTKQQQLATMVNGHQEQMMFTQANAADAGGQEWKNSMAPGNLQFQNAGEENIEERVDSVGAPSTKVLAEMDRLIIEKGSNWRQLPPESFSKRREDNSYKTTTSTKTSKTKTSAATSTRSPSASSSKVSGKGKAVSASSKAPQNHKQEKEKKKENVMKKQYSSRSAHTGATKTTTSKTNHRKKEPQHHKRQLKPKKVLAKQKPASLGKTHTGGKRKLSKKAVVSNRSKKTKESVYSVKHKHQKKQSKKKVASQKKDGAHG